MAGKQRAHGAHTAAARAIEAGKLILRAKNDALAHAGPKAQGAKNSGRGKKRGR